MYNKGTIKGTLLTPLSLGTFKDMYLGVFRQSAIIVLLIFGILKFFQIQICTLDF